MESGYSPNLWTFPVYFGVTVILAGAIIALSAILGEKHRHKDADEPFESGMNITGTAHVRYNVAFYIFAMVFLVFDVETVFIISWAVAADKLGWPGYFEILTFIILLLAALVYLWRVGALHWRRRISNPGTANSDSISNGKGPQ